ncbi:hypothetical protein H4582DRAFT_2078560 [Lactarius indigo]|nr:hypothetical protein H4582DRAFT_2078560 [Lactarius indigo]
MPRRRAAESLLPAEEGIEEVIIHHRRTKRGIRTTQKSVPILLPTKAKAGESSNSKKGKKDKALDPATAEGSQMASASFKDTQAEQWIDEQMDEPPNDETKQSQPQAPREAPDSPKVAGWPVALLISDALQGSGAFQAVDGVASVVLRTLDHCAELTHPSAKSIQLVAGRAEARDLRGERLIVNTIERMVGDLVGFEDDKVLVWVRGAARSGDVGFGVEGLTIDMWRARYNP